MLNIKKTKIMTTRILNEFILDGTEMETISCDTFLGSISPERVTTIKKSIEESQLEEWQ